MKKPVKPVRAPRKGFRVDNRTRWRTEDLRRLVSAVIRRQGGVNHGFVVRFTTGRYSGFAYFGGSLMVVRVPAVPRIQNREHRRYGVPGCPTKVWLWSCGHTSEPGAKHCCAPDRRELVTTIAHELAHLRGLRGERDMRSSKWLGRNRKGDGDTSHYSWADDLPLRPQEAAKVPRASGALLAEKKRQAAEAKVLQWERKKKLAETKLKQWRTKVRYHEKRAAALRATTTPNEE